MDNEDVFVEEISYDELNVQAIVGRGAFGLVSRAEWRGKLVAVKFIETEAERKAFLTELKQLSRVNHENIVTLYGASRNQPVFLVMEYAEGGSLYNVLHAEGIQPTYNSGHAVSWCLQCARGVEYLHGMKPKPLVHRDLKPPNLLLVNMGRKLKICDFGTACDAHTHMTNNKGSAAWMAPEVFEGSNYSEKCDVFSFGIIIWEVLTRKKPFDDIGGPAFRVMWAVHTGTRPPPIQKCPKPIEELMTKCWSGNPIERPPFVKIVQVLTKLSEFFQGEDEPLFYPHQQAQQQGEDSLDESCNTQGSSVTSETPPQTQRARSHDTVRLASEGEMVNVNPPTPKAPKPVVVEVQVQHRRTSAPASIAGSHENLEHKSRSSTPVVDPVNKRYSVDLSRLEEKDYSGESFNSGKFVKSHRRSGSYGTPFVAPEPLVKQVLGHRRTNSHGSSPMSSTPDLSAVTRPQPVTGSSSADNLHIVQPEEEEGKTKPNGGGSVPSGDVSTNLFISDLLQDPQIQPLTPCDSSLESVSIYRQHLELKQKYIQVQAEMAVLTQQKHDSMQELKSLEDEIKECEKLEQEIKDFDEQNANLERLWRDMKEDLEKIREAENNESRA